MKPPGLLKWFLERTLSPGHDSVVGDLEEEYYDVAAAHGPRRAAWWYGARVLGTVPPLLINDLFWGAVMLKNYLTVAVRTLLKYKGFSAINITGLAVSMSACLLIITVIRDQKGYDRFHAQSDRIYRVISEAEFSYGRFKMATSPAPLGPALVASGVGVERVVRMSKFGGHASVGEAAHRLHGLFAEPSFFGVFGFALERGDAGTALGAPNTIVLTREAAGRFFGEADPLGEVVHLEGEGDFVVTGVLAPPPGRTHLDFEALASFATVEPRVGTDGTVRAEDWSDATGFYNYVVLADGASPEEVEARSNSLVEQYFTLPDRTPSVHQLQAVTDINLGLELSNQIGVVMPVEAGYMLTLFAFLLILVAVFNYVSLSIARSLKRAKEIGIRKVVGAHRGQIVRQFLTESVVVALVALVAAAVFLVWLLPAFNGLSVVQDEFGEPVVVDFMRDGGLYVLFVGFAVVVGMLAGLYPAFVMSGYLPTVVLKGLSRIRGFSGMTLRKVLVVFQFTLSTVGVVFILVVYQQFSLIMRANYGFDQEQLVNIALQEAPYETLRGELLRHPAFVDVAATSSTPVVGTSNSNTTIQAPGMEQPMLLRYYAVDEHFLGQFRVQLLAGRNFSAEYPSDRERAVLLNEEALQTLGLGTPEEAVGTTLTFSSRAYTVVGVVANFFTDGYHKGFRPIALSYWPNSYQYAVARIAPGQVEPALAHLEATWKALNPTLALEYVFYDDQMQASFSFVSDLVWMIGLVSGFIIFITCLGLLGMAGYSAESRVREVGIRKVLGADVRGMVVLLSREYLKLMAVAVALAVPLAWLLSRAFLQHHVNRIEPGVGIFLAGVVPVLLLALLTVGSQALRAALTNPVETLRHE